LRIVLAWLTFLAALTFNHLLLADSLDAKTDSLLRAAMDQAFHEKYSEAMRTADAMIAADPENHLGYFVAASVRLAIMHLYRTRRYDKEFLALVDKAIKIGKKRSKRGGAWDYFFLGGAYGFRGDYKALHYNWVGAFADGWKGLQSLDRALQYDPNLYDAYYGFGLYHYWRSALAGVLRAVPFVGDERQKGIREIQLAIDRGQYSRVIATFSLVEIYYHEKEYKKALELNNSLMATYPTNIAWLYMDARLRQALGQWKEAAEAAQRLINHINRSLFRTEGFLAEAYWVQADAYRQMNQLDAARRATVRGLQLAESRDDSKEIDGPWESFSQIRKRLKQLAKDLDID